MNAPIWKAEEVYGREQCDNSFEVDVWAHLRLHYVHSTPDFFIMGKAVRKDAPFALICDPHHVFDPKECDCWHLYLFAGDMAKAWAIMPSWYDWFSFQRKNELRVYPAARIRELSRPM